MHSFSEYFKKGNFFFEVNDNKFVFSDHLQIERKDRMSLEGGVLTRKGIMQIIKRGTPCLTTDNDVDRKIMVVRLPKSVFYAGQWCTYAFVVLEHTNQTHWVAVTCCYTNDLRRSGIGHPCKQKLSFQI